MYAHTTYRREHRTAPAIPVAMPLVEVAIDSDGYLAIALDGEAYAAEGALTRTDLAGTVSGITNDLGTPVRLEVHEADGQRFTEILLPGRKTSASPTDSEHIDRTANVSAFGVVGTGFAPGEEVAICVVVAAQVADVDGATHLRLPPALVAKRPDVILVGKRSGYVAASPSAPAAASGGVA